MTSYPDALSHITGNYSDDFVLELETFRVFDRLV